MDEDDARMPAGAGEMTDHPSGRNLLKAGKRWEWSLKRDAHLVVRSWMSSLQRNKRVNELTDRILLPGHSRSIPEIFEKSQEESIVVVVSRGFGVKGILDFYNESQRGRLFGRKMGRTVV